MKYSRGLIGLFSITNLILFYGLLSGQASAQVSGNDRGMAMKMLEMTRNAVKDNYFDPKFRGVNVDEVFTQTKEKMKSASTRDELMMLIAQAVVMLDDSHTNFYPPDRAADIEYGWRLAMIGDDCFVSRVKPKTDAEAKGVKRGDKLLAIDGIRPTRELLPHLYHRYYQIAPAARVKMVLQSLGEKPRTLDIQTKISKTATVHTWTTYEQKVTRKGWWDYPKVDEFVEFGSELLIWKLHSFARSESGIDSAMNKARNFKTLILDLRGNGGGYLETGKQLVGHFFENETKIGDHKMRDKAKPLSSKGRGSGRFSGNLIVLVDQDSASASEVIAKVIQIEKRGKIIGDRTSGSVMTSRFFPMDFGFGNNLYFGVSVTVGDLIMTDGKSLEKRGVTPDETVLPAGKDWAEGKDPVLAYAAKLAGVDLTPEKAGTFFPFEWPK